MIRWMDITLGSMPFLVKVRGSLNEVLFAGERYLCRLNGVICWKKGEGVFDDSRGR